MKRKVRMGMVGGGPAAFIGEVHRKAARLDGKIEILAGAFDIDPAQSRKMGEMLCLDPTRVYDTYQQMIEQELKRPDPVDFITIATPNKWHFPIANDCLKAGFHVMCEKPMTLTLNEAVELKKVVEQTGKVFGLMHNYTAYPMVKLARDMVRQGDIGKVLKIVVQYPQGWLIKPIEREGSPQAAWRTDPKQSGAGGCVGDIGTHAANLAEYVSGLKIQEICAELTTFVAGRQLDDDANALLRFNNGARGLLHASQISVGQENNLAIWVHGDKGSLEWHQEDPNELVVCGMDQPVQVWRRGNDYIGRKSPAAARATRIPFGHPEAFLEAFANNYVNFADTIAARIENRAPTEWELDFPGVEQGVRGMAFIETMVASASSDAKWTCLPDFE